ncbi:MAG: RIP metalloprotease RseP [Candidatus Omnitrophota bacterium]
MFLTIIFVVIIFSIIIIVHEAGHLFAAKACGVKVEVFSLGFGRRLFGVKKGGTDYRISLFPLGGYVKMAGEEPSEVTGKEDELASKPVGHRFWIIAAGSLTNYFFAFVLFSIVFMLGAPMLSTEIGEVLREYPAARAGLKAGDQILAINGSGVKYWEDVVKEIRRSPVSGYTLNMEVMRGEKRVNIDVKPDIRETRNIFGQPITRYMIGIAPARKLLPVSYDPLRALYYGGKKLLTLTGMTYQGIWLLVSGALPLGASVTGPIGIARLMGEAVHLGVVPLLVITAHISMALGIFNLLPFPVLDGGHIIFLGLEKLRGKPLSVKAQETITQIALVLLIVFMLFVSWQDLLKFTPLGKRGIEKQKSVSLASDSAKKQKA